ncbi:hypothetical protein GBF38_002222 [Nibea albiflora]|uniref:Uncharacterized protein n=1 Tax=Nibea albiflora TaxID=240163 RepID=A0ACB7EDY5_NIBAL|nr:hypothetical protein GBF38_002222 [Nibea albiflora]
MDDKGKMSWGVEVEPPEDMDESDLVIDPRMKIWKNMMSSGQNKLLKAGEDSDKQFQPSMTDLIKFQLQNQGVSAVLSAANDQAEPSQKDDSLKLTEDSEKLLRTSVSDLLKTRLQNQGVSAFLSAADVHAEPSQKDGSLKLTEDSDKLLHWSSPRRKMPTWKSYQEPEEDRDDIDHPAFSDSLKEPEQDWEKVVAGYLSPLVAQYKDGAKVHAVQSEPEMDEDELYHRDNQPVQMEPLGHEVVGESAAARVEEPFQRKYDEPEEDLDDLYH